MSDPDWRERVALVTGGSDGIGRAIVETIVERGGHVATIARRGDRLKALAEMGVVTVEGDVTIDGGAERLVASAVDAFGRVDALVNNVGRGALTPWDAPVDHWIEMFEVNTISAVRMCRAAVPVLRESSSPRIVNIGTELVYKPDHDLVAYTAAKAALLSFSKSLSVALAEDGILVNVVSPGTVATDQVISHYRNRATAKGRSLGDELTDFIRQRRQIPLDRLAEPREIAEVVAFAASGRLTFSTGAVFRCDGGSAPTPL